MAHLRRHRHASQFCQHFQALVYTPSINYQIVLSPTFRIHGRVILQQQTVSGPRDALSVLNDCWNHITKSVKGREGQQSANQRQLLSFFPMPLVCHDVRTLSVILIHLPCHFYVPASMMATSSSTSHCLRCICLPAASRWERLAHAILNNWGRSSCSLPDCPHRPWRACKFAKSPTFTSFHHISSWQLTCIWFMYMLHTYVGITHNNTLHFQNDRSSNTALTFSRSLPSLPSLAQTSVLLLILKTHRCYFSLAWAEENAGKNICKEAPPKNRKKQASNEPSSIWRKRHQGCSVNDRMPKQPDACIASGCSLRGSQSCQGARPPHDTSKFALSASRGTCRSMVKLCTALFLPVLPVFSLWSDLIVLVSCNKPGFRWNSLRNCVYYDSLLFYLHIFAFLVNTALWYASRWWQRCIYASSTGRNSESIAVDGSHLIAVAQSKPLSKSQMFATLNAL